MPSLDYRQLSRPQKLAVFLICMGPEAAAEVLRQFDDTEVEKICREMAGFPMITEEIRRQAMDEFSDVVSASVKSSLGGMPFARRTLALARGEVVVVAPVLATNPLFTLLFAFLLLRGVERITPRIVLPAARASASRLSTSTTAPSPGTSPPLVRPSSTDRGSPAKPPPSDRPS